MKDSNYGWMTFAIAVAALVMSCSGYRAPAGGTFLPLHSLCSTMGRAAGHAQAARTSMLSAATLATTRLDEHARWKRGELEDDLYGRRSQGARYARDAATQAKIHCELAAMADTRLASMTEAANVRPPEQASDLGSPTSCAWTDELLAPTAEASAAIAATRQAAASRDAAQRWAVKSCDEMAGYGPASEAPTIDARHVCAALTQLVTAARPAFLTSLRLRPADTQLFAGRPFVGSVDVPRHAFLRLWSGHPANNYVSLVSLEVW